MRVRVLDLPQEGEKPAKRKIQPIGPVHPWEADPKVLRRAFKLLPLEIACGLHSGFPPCCIIFYTMTWDFMNVDQHLRYRVRMKKAGTWGYVPCPKCLRAKNQVRVKRCPKNCGMRLAV